MSRTWLTRAAGLGGVLAILGACAATPPTPEVVTPAPPPLPATAAPPAPATPPAALPAPVSASPAPVLSLPPDASRPAPWPEFFESEDLVIRIRAHEVVQ